MGGPSACLLRWEINCPSTCEGQFSPGQPHKPHSVRQRRGNHLSGIVVADDLERCTRCFLRNGPLHDTCFTLLPMGFTWPSTLLPMPVRSYRTFSPSHPCECNLLSVALAVRSPCPAVNRHRCPVECGLSSTRTRLAAIPSVNPEPSLYRRTAVGLSAPWPWEWQISAIYHFAEHCTGFFTTENTEGTEILSIRLRQAGISSTFASPRGHGEDYTSRAWAPAYPCLTMLYSPRKIT